MHTNIFALLLGCLKRTSLRLFTASILAVVFLTPAFAQEAASGNRSGSILNILLLGGVAYFLVRSFRRRGGSDDTRPGRWSKPDQTEDDVDQSEQPSQRTLDRHEAAKRTWDMLSSDKGERPVSTTATVPQPEVRADGFDEVEFLEGAKLFYARFQQARAEQDFQDIRDFISDDVFADSMTNGGQGRIEIMLLNAKLMELKSENGQTLASVFYDAQLKVGEQGERAEHVRTVWEFIRDDSSPNGLWVLETINSVDQ